MRIAIVNPITKTVDMPNRKGSILGLSPTPPYSDEEVNIVELASEISKLGNEVTLFISDAYKPTRETASNQNGLQIKYLPTRYKTIFPPAYLPYIPSLPNELTINDFDLIQSGEIFQWGTILASRASRRRKIPLVIWQELDINPQFPGGLLQIIYNKTYGQLVNQRVCSYIPRSESAKNFLKEIRIDNRKIAPTIHTGVNTKIYYPMKGEGFKEKFGIDSESILILSVGRLHPNKGFDVLIKAVAKVLRKIPNISLIIKGNGPQRFALNQLINNLHLEAHVKIISDHYTRNIMNELYAASDFTVISSKIDLFPFSAIESIACGRPIISRFGRAIYLDILNLNRTGIYVKDQSIDTFADAISYLALNPQIRLEMGNNAYQLCKKEFQLEEVSKRFLKAYQQLTDLN